MAKIKNNLIFSVLFLILFAAPSFADFSEDLMNMTPIDRALLPMREINLKLGFDFSGIVDSNVGIGQYNQSSFVAGNNASFSAEYFKYFNEYVAAGAGASAEVLRWMDTFPGKFCFAPVYAALKVRSWPQEPGMYGYAVGHIGYGFMYGNSSFNDSLKVKNGGIYYAFGFGIVYKYVIVEALYGYNHGAVKDKTSGGGANIVYSSWRLSIGYKF